MKALLFICLSLSVASYSQDSTRLDEAIEFPSKLFSSLDKKTRSVEQRLDHKTNAYLDKLERREKRLYRKLLRKDSVLAKLSFGNIDSTYNALRNINGNVGKYSNVYSAHLDSLNTMMKFLGQGKLDPSAIQQNMASYKKLQQQLNISDQVKRKLVERQKHLKEKLLTEGLPRQFKGYQRDVYYYSAQVKECKQQFENPSHLEQKLMQAVVKTKLFKSFFERNSEICRLFPASGGNGYGMVAASAGQTRASVNQLLVERFGSPSFAAQAIGTNVQSAQGQINELKSKALGYTSGKYGNGDGEMPSFRVNGQKTKPFLQRLELGSNIQSQKSRNYFPSTTDVGLSLGFKLDDSKVLGIGISYKLGLGKNWDHIAISHQGIGLRSFLDIRLKGSIYVSGGYEQNYLSIFKTIVQLQTYDAWQTSGLLGISKRYTISKRFKGEMKLLWDFLSYRQMPRSQPVLFRIGYNLK